MLSTQALTTLPRLTAGVFLRVLHIEHMANYSVRILGMNGYSAHDEVVEGVINQQQAKKVAEARCPGAKLGPAKKI